jgi:hypothetical protein
MLDMRECLFVTFTYDHAAGVFYAQLANGSRFAVERQHIGGKLENALNLHKRAVIDLNSGKYVQAKGSRGQLTYSYDDAQIKRFTAAGYRDVELPPLELELGDLEL